MDLMTYLNDHSNPMGGDNAHRRFLNYISSRLDHIGIPPDSCVFWEVAMSYNGFNIGRVDLAALDMETLYLVEAKVARKGPIRKGGELGNTRNRINRQLRKAHDFFEKLFGIDATCIGVYRRSGAQRFDSYELYR
ncbi:MAG: hypothetical protein HY051_04580 [Candidatus Aenigmarchaeota archaeon]|nr:hypothetical protein [Candidatus Aenigmarchaeota archaeon]